MRNCYVAPVLFFCDERHSKNRLTTDVYISYIIFWNELIDDIWIPLHDHTLTD